MTPRALYTPTRAEATEWLLRAINQRDEAAALRWLKAGGDPNTATAPGDVDHMLASAIRSRSSALMCKILLEHGALAHPKGADRSLLWAAVENEDRAVCEELVRHGADVNEHSREDMTLLMVAASQSRLEVCEFLIEAGCEVRFSSKRGNTALHMAVRGSNPERSLATVKLLLAHGATTFFAPHHHNKWYLTPFQQAVLDGSGIVVAHMIEQCGENPAQLTFDGRKMLDIAGNDEVKQVLGMALTEQALRSAAGDPLLAADGSGRVKRTPSPL